MDHANPEVQKSYEAIFLQENGGTPMSYPSPAPPRQPARLATAERKSVWEPRMGSPHLFLGEKVRTQSSCLETSENLRKSPRTVETFENLRLWIRTLKTVESPAGRVSECYKHFGPLTKSIYKSCILINPISQSVQFSCSLLRAQVNHSACHQAASPTECIPELHYQSVRSCRNIASRNASEGC